MIKKTQKTKPINKKVVEKEEGLQTEEPSSTQTQEENLDKTQSLSIEQVREHGEYQELNNKYLRLYAEFENFRNRSARESLENYQTAGAELIQKILPTIENLERSISPKHKVNSLEDFEKGIQLILKQLKDHLSEAGLKEINPEGKDFDPQLHEALMQQAHPKIKENCVIEVFQKGYQFKNKILKHAQVITSKGKE